MRAVLTDGPERKHLFALGWPMLVGIIAVIGFNVVDTFFIAQLGEIQLAAISYTFPIVTLMASIALGLGAGVSSLVSRSLGRGEKHRTCAYTTDGLSLSLLIVVLFTALGLATIDPVFRMMGAEAETLPLIRDYMNIWYLNMVFVVVPMVGNSVIRATGNARFPAAVMIFAGVVNAILDPLLIFGLWGFPRMELEGAALATLISRMLTFIAAIYVLHYRKQMLVNPFRGVAEVIGNWKSILSLGAVNALNNTVVPLSALLMTAYVSQFGEQSVAAFGIGTRIESLVMIPIIAVAAALSPFAGQNWGAKKQNRIEKILTEAKKFTFCWLAFIFVLFAFGLESMIGWFTQNANVAGLAWQYVMLVLPSMIPLAAVLYINTVYSATGRPIVSLRLTVFRVLVVLLPLALLLMQFFDVTGVFVAIALANLAGGLLAYFIYQYRFRAAN